MTGVRKAAARPKPAQSSNGYVSSVWDFPPDVDVSYAAHTIYRWYGTLPGPLVGRLLDLYADPQSALPVWDPMCGGGTTLVEARLRGIPAVGWDVNPLACLVARAKIHSGAVSIADVDSALEWIRARAAAPNWTGGFGDDSFAYAGKWFETAALDALLELTDVVAQVPASPSTERILLLALAASTRDIAEVDPRCTHHLVRKRKVGADPFDVFERKARGLAGALAAAPNLDQVSRISVDQCDMASASEPPPSSLAIVHPPYLGIIHYHLIHRLGTELLRWVNERRAPECLDGFLFDPDWIRSVDGSTDHEGAYGHFVDRMCSTLEQGVVPGGHAVVIMGDGRHKGLLRHSFTNVIGVMESHGFAMEENFIWLLQNNGGMHVLRRGHHIDHNYIMVFRRQA